jgi:hypothetical protein
VFFSLTESSARPLRHFIFLFQSREVINTGAHKMTTTTATETKKQKLDARATSLKKARARLRQTQRQEQAARLRKIGEVLEAAAGGKLTLEDVELLGRVLALAAVVPFSAREVLGGLLVVRDSLAKEADSDSARRKLAAAAAAYLPAP